MWPTDIITVWGPTVERTTAQGKSPADAMANYIDLLSIMGGDLTDPEAIQIVEDYKDYWYLLEQDLTTGTGQAPSEDSQSTKEGARLLKYCSQFDPELKEALK